MNRSNNSGHLHMMALAVLVAVVVVAGGVYVYYQGHKPSVVKSAATRTELKQTAAELKKVDLGDLAKSVHTVSSVQGSFNFKKSNNK